ncbi:hypothetical protein PR202_ga12309 [Eleusine coracana subsp. coracana]|uniref:Uncharacterized protein n=1 Tax=Eleusine coracana subsp. coracana TaxID=191504 RepID=A0AAV5CB89_ELECO|nr:hypothetical protein PR202_ga12309 [Eleusine coracana subsp. coracana]
MAPPIIILAPDIAATSGGSLLNAALHGNLGRLKGIVKNLGMGPADVLAVIIDGFGGVLHCAAAHGHLEVCKYLVEELGGSCKVTEFLLSQGIPVDIDCGRGTPLFQAAGTREDKTLKILLDHNANPNTVVRNVGNPLMCAFLYHNLKCMELLIEASIYLALLNQLLLFAGADVNGKGPSVSPLLFATGQGDYTDFIPLLLKAGADPNVPDDLGWLPIVRAAFRECREEIEVLLPLTSPIPDVPNWSVDGVISYAQFKKTQPVVFVLHQKLIQAGYNKPNATLYSNRSLCKLKMGDGEGALSDAKQCRMIQPGWAKACYRQGAAHMLLKPQRARICNVQEYKQACEAFQDAEKLDPGNEEIERELG